MQQLRDRELRRALHTAFVSRASDVGPPELDNTETMAEILALRQEEAGLLGHPDYASLSLVPKMAASTAQVLSFLQDLVRRARPHAERELRELRAFATSELGLDELQPWDVLFATERLREARYAFSQEEVKAHFTLPRVLEGLLRVIETLFEVDFAPEPSPDDPPHVQRLRVARRDAPSQAIAHLLLDLHARPGKRPGAWMAGARSRWARPDAAGRTQTPVAHIVCNFASGQDGRPALLAHGDVLTLLHEFGHGLHHVLTRSRELATSGTAGVEWDAIELPSLFMENLGWEWDVLRRMSTHVDTGEPLPRTLYERMLAARNFQGGIGLLRQLEYSLFDWRIHTEPDSERRVREIADDVYREAGVLPRNPDDRYPWAFLHLFAGGYAAGYYSYKWAEVLSSDAWSAFEQAGVLDAPTGARYRREILETGGSRPAMESFRAFRGREPRIDALLRRLGLE
jgi:oligopeptidase A